jgi:hypothetical protein
MTATTAPSAYPRTVDELIPHARDLADRLGELPSRNKLMKTFRVGPDKAKALLVALAPAPAAPSLPEPAEPDPVEPTAEATVTPPVLPPTDPAGEMVSVGIVSPAAEPELIHLQRQTPTGVVLAGVACGATGVCVTPTFREVTCPDCVIAEHERLHEPDDQTPPEPVDEPDPKRRRPIVWPVLILCLPAFVAIWGGWVEMGRRTGFGMVTLLPGISDFQIDTSITLPVGVETYAAYALYVWLSGMVTGPALKFAKWSALASLLLGALGQVAYHLMAAAGWETAPWPITAAVSCIPVAVLGMGAALAHLMHRSH